MKMPNFALNSVFAKVKALYGKRLTERDYNQLLKAESINDIAEYLRNGTSYSEIFEGLSSNEELQRSRLETLLFNKMYNEMIAVIRFQKAAGNSLFEYFIMKYDIEQIVKVLSSLETKSKNYFFTFPVFYNERSKLDLYALALAKNDTELLKCTKHTVYHTAVHEALTKYRLTGSLTAFQTDLSYFLDRQFIKLTSGKKKPDSKSELMKLYMCINDIDLVRTLYRIKRFAVKENFANTMASPVLTAFTSKELENMKNASTTQELTERLKKTYMKDIVCNTENSDIYHALTQYLFNQLTATLHRSTDASAVMFAYFHFAEIEIRNIIHIIEGKRYNLTEEEIRESLCGEYTPQKGR